MTITAKILAATGRRLFLVIVIVLAIALAAAAMADADDDDDDDDDDDNPSGSAYVAETWPVATIAWPPRVAETTTGGSQIDTPPIIMPQGQLREAPTYAVPPVTGINDIPSPNPSPIVPVVVQP